MSNEHILTTELLANNNRTEKDWIELSQSLEDEIEDLRRQLKSECDASMKLWNDSMDLRTQIAIHLANKTND
jgi:hypothetical protein